jgi:hypothetical protein
MKNNNDNNQSGNKIPFLGALRPIEMIGIGILVFAALLYGVSKCSSDKKAPKENTKTEGTEQLASDPKSDALRRSLYVSMDSLRMRRAPHKDSSAVKILGYGEELTDMGEYQNEQTIKISPEYSVTEPWVKVKTSDGRIGWVFGGGVRPYPKNKPTPQEKEKEKEKTEEKPKTEEKTKTDTKEKTTSNKNSKKTETKDR